MLDEEEIRLTSLFAPHLIDRYRRIVRTNGRFVHYTTAETATSIIRGEMVWMRNARLMNDFSEIEHGLSRLLTAYRSPVGERLKQAIETTAPGLTKEVEELFDGWSPRFAECTYMACVSEHRRTEDHHGRLSMWRAYGGQTSVALVMNNAPFLSPSDVLQAYASPVLYADQNRFNQELGRVANNLRTRRAEVEHLDRETIKARIFNVFYFASLCTKHPGFYEEREWRVIHSSEMHPSKHLVRSLETIRGVPQIVYKIPLQDIDGDNGETLRGTTIPDLLERVIIGPSEAGPAVRDAFIDLLQQAGVSAPESKVFSSGIPLRG